MLNYREDYFLDELIGNDENCYSIKRLYDEDDVLAALQVLNAKDRIYKCLFYEEGTRLSNLTIYNTETGREIKNITYRNDGKTISSIREYNLETEKLLSVTFYKEDGQSPSSIIEYNDKGDEASFTLFCENGQTITQAI